MGADGWTDGHIGVTRDGSRHRRPTEDATAAAAHGVVRAANLAIGLMTDHMASHTCSRPRVLRTVCVGGCCLAAVFVCDGAKLWERNNSGRLEKAASRFGHKGLGESRWRLGGRRGRRVGVDVGINAPVYTGGACWQRAPYLVRGMG